MHWGVCFCEESVRRIWNITTDDRDRWNSVYGHNVTIIISFLVERCKCNGEYLAFYTAMEPTQRI